MTYREYINTPAATKKLIRGPKYGDYVRVSNKDSFYEGKCGRVVEDVGDYVMIRLNNPVSRFRCEMAVSIDELEIVD